jgi:hypothetical protein
VTTAELKDLARILRETYFRAHGIAHATYSAEILSSWEKVAAKAVETIKRTSQKKGK